jgi:hypothetical protein
MTQNKVLLTIGIALLLIGFFKPDLSSWIPVGPAVVEPSNNCVIDAPADTNILEKAKIVKNILLASNDSTRKADCAKLSSLYCDIATLIDLDNEDMVIKDTSTVKEANSLSGKMLRLNIKDKYPNLAEASEKVVVVAIGEDDVLLDGNMRTKAVEAFRALSWAFYEGSK